MNQTITEAVERIEAFLINNSRLLGDLGSVERERIKKIIQSAIDSTGTNWIRTSERPPTETDSDRNGDVLVVRHLPNGFESVTLRHWSVVIVFPGLNPFWMKIPPVPNQ